MYHYGSLVFDIHIEDTIILIPGDLSQKREV